MPLKDISAEDLLEIMSILNNDSSPITRRKILIIGENMAKNATTICPVCEEDVEISERELKIALQHAKNGVALVSCSNCCRVLVLPEAEGDMQEWINEVIDNEDPIPCIELEGVVARMPLGFEEHMGVKEFQPAGGYKKLPKRDYMYAYGINPVCALTKMGRDDGPAPFVIGGRK